MPSMAVVVVVDNRFLKINTTILIFINLLNLILC